MKIEHPFFAGGAAVNPILLPNGSAAAPSLAFSSDQDIGLFYTTSALSISIAGTKAHEFTASGIYVFSDTATLLLGASSDTTLTRDAANILALRNGANAQTFRIYASYTDGSNYEYGSIAATAGFLTISTATAGTGTDNIDMVLASSGTGGINRKATATTGGYKTIAYEATATLSGATTVIQVNIPAGVKILGCQLRVDTLVASGDGGTSWAAAYSGGSTQAICTGQAFTKNTKANCQYNYNLDDDGVPAAEVDITIDCDGASTFNAGVIRAIVFCETFTAMADAA